MSEKNPDGEFPYKLEKPNEKMLQDLENQLRIEGEVDFDMDESSKTTDSGAHLNREAQARAQLLRKAEKDFDGQSEFPSEEKPCVFILEQKGDPGTENNVIQIKATISGEYFNTEKYHMKVIADKQTTNGARLEVYELTDSAVNYKNPVFVDSTIEWKDLREIAETESFKEQNMRAGHA